MIVRFADLDGDKDLDVVLACEFQRNRVLLNDGTGRLTDVTETSLAAHQRDSEDLVIADLNGDGRPDLVFVSEDGQTNELYLNMGGGRFVERTDFPAGGTSNAVVALDLNRDGNQDLILGNRGQNVVLINDGRAGFTVDTTGRLPPDTATTQDLELGDVDGDGDLDLIVGNEGRNRLLLSDDQGRFTDVTEDRLPSSTPHDETRGVYGGDVDRDGDLDIFFANAGRTGGLSRQDRLLINDGRGVFTDQTAARLPVDTEEAMGGRLVDLDGDGGLDIVIATYRGQQGPATPYRAFRNAGQGVFTDATAALFPPGVTGHGFDVEAGDLNGDGRMDLYLASGRSRDRLLLSQAE
jgi:hypothetical protein